MVVNVQDLETGHVSCNQNQSESSLLISIIWKYPFIRAVKTTIFHIRVPRFKAWLQFLTTETLGGNGYLVITQITGLLPPYREQLDCAVNLDPIPAQTILNLSCPHPHLSNENLKYTVVWDKIFRSKLILLSCGIELFLMSTVVKMAITIPTTLKVQETLNLIMHINQHTYRKHSLCFS